jgi:hypothetical protein
MRVGGEPFDVTRIALENFNLRQHGIGLEINPQRGAQVLLAQWS